jgi:hypothetical protein
MAIVVFPVPRITFDQIKMITGQSSFENVVEPHDTRGESFERRELPGGAENRSILCFHFGNVWRETRIHPCLHPSGSFSSFTRKAALKRL